MADNEVQIVFTGVDNVSGVADSITTNINRLPESGKIGNDASEFARDVEFQKLGAEYAAESAAQIADIEADIGRQFAAVRGEIIETTETVQEFDVVNEAAFLKAGVVVGAVGAAMGMIKNELDEIIVLSKERPELFTAEEIANVTAYEEQLGLLKDQWLTMKVNVGTAVMPGLTDLMEQMNAAPRAMEMATEAGKIWGFTNQEAWIDLAIKEDAAIEKTESFDRTLMAVEETAAIAADGVSQSADEMGVSFDAANGPMERTLALMESIAAYGGKVVKFGVAFQSTGTNAVNSATYGATGRGANLNYLTQEVTKRQTGRH